MEKEHKFDAEDECKPGLESARNLRSMFESMKDQPTTPEKPRPKVNRFIVSSRYRPVSYITELLSNYLAIIINWLRCD